MARRGHPTARISATALGAHALAEDNDAVGERLGFPSRRRHHDGRPPATSLRTAAHSMRVGRRVEIRRRLSRNSSDGCRQIASANRA
jgi:hypothetical protein